MRLPGFVADVSLYKVSSHYQIAGGLDYSQGVTLQENSSLGFRHCGSCYWSDGQCVQDCTTCIPCPPGVKPNGCGGCDTVTVPCKAPGKCPPLPPCCPKGCVGVCP